METVYLETTVISYLVARLSRDLIVAGHQQTTQEWWLDHRAKFDCYVSQVVIDEAGNGDPGESAKRLAAIGSLQMLDMTTGAEALTDAILRTGVIPPRAVRDAAHVGVAAFHGIDFMLTWNCKHLANAQIKRKISAVCVRLGYRMPIICTPEELMGE